MHVAAVSLVFVSPVLMIPRTTLCVSPAVPLPARHFVGLVLLPKGSVVCLNNAFLSVQLAFGCTRWGS